MNSFYCDYKFTNETKESTKSCSGQSGPSENYLDARRQEIRVVGGIPNSRNDIVNLISLTTTIQYLHHILWQNSQKEAIS